MKWISYFIGQAFNGVNISLGRNSTGQACRKTTRLRSDELPSSSRLRRDRSPRQAIHGPRPTPLRFGGHGGLPHSVLSPLHPVLGP
jgi:hypothetical protein